MHGTEGNHVHWRLGYSETVLSDGQSYRQRAPDVAPRLVAEARRLFIPNKIRIDHHIFLGSVPQRYQDTTNVDENKGLGLFSWKSRASHGGTWIRAMVPPIRKHLWGDPSMGEQHGQNCRIHIQVCPGCPECGCSSRGGRRVVKTCPRPSRNHARIGYRRHEF